MAIGHSIQSYFQILNLKCNIPATLCYSIYLYNGTFHGNISYKFIIKPKETKDFSNL